MRGSTIQNIALNTTYDSDGNQAPCCFQVPPQRSYGNIFKEVDALNSGNKVLRNAYRSPYWRGGFRKGCYFRSGLDNRYR